MRESLLFSISCCAVAALYGQEAADPVSFRCEGIRYQVNADNTANVTVVNVEGYKGADLQLPAQVTDDATGITYQVTAIGTEAFYGSPVQNLAIPASVDDIAGNAFFNANYLKAISVSDENGSFTGQDGILYNKEMTCLRCFPSYKSFGTYTLPASVTEIGDYAFCGVSVNKFDIPASVTGIGRGAFMGTKLKKMVVPPTVKEIGGEVFQNCGSLESIEFPDGMTVLPDHALTYCKMLKTLKLPESLTEIGDYAFDGAFVYGSSYGLISDLVLPSNVRKIGIGSFYGNHGLVSVTLGSQVETIGLYAFTNCTNLSELKSLNESVPLCLNEDGGNDVVYTFSGVPESCVLYVPGNSVAVYKAGWGDKFKDIRPVETGGVDNVGMDCGDVRVSVANGLLEVEAPASIEVFNSAGVLVARAADGSLSVDLSSGIYVVSAGTAILKVVL